MLTRQGVLVEKEGSTYVADNDGDADETRGLTPLQAAACTYRIAFGPRAGQKVLTVQGAMPTNKDFKQTLCADIDDFSLHAAVRCGADNRQALEQLCRCITRPALANERMQTNAAGQVVLKLKTAWRHGTTHPVMSPLDRHGALPELRWRAEDHCGDPGTASDRDDPHALASAGARTASCDGPWPSNASGLTLPNRSQCSTVLRPL